MWIYKHKKNFPTGFKKYVAAGMYGREAHHCVGWRLSLFGVYIDYSRNKPGNDEKMPGVYYGPMIRIGTPSYVLC
jgi:hypothetical protein